MLHWRCKVIKRILAANILTYNILGLEVKVSVCFGCLVKVSQIPAVLIITDVLIITGAKSKMHIIHSHMYQISLHSILIKFTQSYLKFYPLSRRKFESHNRPVVT